MALLFSTLAGAQCATELARFDFTGAIQNYTVSANGNYWLEAAGAQGSFNTSSTTSSGKGAFIGGSFVLAGGTQLKILAGQQVTNSAGNGGGGGTFVTLTDNTPLVVAGGGGGSSAGADSPDKDGQAGNNGGTGAGGGGTGGTAGNGGGIGPSGFQSGAGGGLLSNGSDGWTSGTGGAGFVNGGAGGATNAPANGGFGGGGSGSSYVVGGAGGGYSGGGSGGNSTAGVGGGGGSFNAGSNQVNQTGAQSGSGYARVCSFVTITVAPASLPNGTVGVSYNQTISASGGSAPYTFAVTSGALPTSLTLSPAGVLSGTPTVGGSFTFTITATDSGSASGAQTYTVTIDTPTIVVAPATLPNGTVGVPYSQTLTASGGSSPYTFAVSSGALPTSLTLSAAGVLSGTPSASGTFSFTVTATDAFGSTGSQSYSITVSAPTIVVAPSSLPNGTVGAAYSQNISASGGSGPYTFALTAGTLPPGITLSAAGLLSGAPTATGTFNFTVTATDAFGSTGAQSYSVTIAAPLITLAPATLPGGSVGVAYSQTLTASGGTAPYTFSLSGGTLPPSLTLSAAGVLSGTPSAGGTFNFTVTATDSFGSTGSQAYSVTIATPVVVAPPSLPNGGVGVAYSQTITASGGSGPYTFAVTAGTLPSSLSLSAAGVLSGTPSASGTFNFTITATDSLSATGAQSYSITIAAPVVISTTSLPNGSVALAYNQTISASGGTSPYTFAVTAGTLPTSLTLNSNGQLSGTPTASGTFTFTVTATDSLGASGSQNYSVTIAPAGAIVISPATLPAGTLGAAYSQTLGASGGSAPYTFAVTSGALPGGLTLNAGGQLTGTPTATGVFNFTVTATDALNNTGAQAYALSILGPVSAAAVPATDAWSAILLTALLLLVAAPRVARKCVS